MFLTLLDRIGEWNPQLFREIKGRFTRRNFLIAVVASLIVQLLLFGAFGESHCLRQVGSECAEFYWEVKWQFLFRTFNWLLPTILLIGGVHMLIVDVTREERRGTLNFIRLSPQSSQNILSGKMLGVPALIYLGVALAVPLHFVAGLAAKVPFSWLLGIYTLWGAGCGLCYTAGLLIAALGDSQSSEMSKAGAGCVLVFFFGSTYISAIDFSFDWSKFSYNVFDGWKWFFFPLGKNPLLAWGFVMITVCTASYWFWQAVNRRFRNSNATLLSKSQSYWLVAGVEIWLLGWFWPELGSTYARSSVFYELGFVAAVNLCLFLILMAALSPHRQTLQDWARYRHQNNHALRSQNPEEMLDSGAKLRSPLVRDLMWGEKSPAPLAIALNLAIAILIWLPWVLLWPAGTPKLQAIAGLVLNSSLILIYAFIVQLVLFAKAKRRGWLAVSAVNLTLGLPPILLALLSINPNSVPVLWLFSVFPWVALQNAAIGAILLAFLAQCSVLGLLNLQLTRKLQQAGASNSKALLPGSH